MPFQPAPDVIQLTVRAQLTEQDCLTMFNVVPTVTVPLTTEVVTDAATIVRDAWEDNALPLLGSNYVMQSVDGLAMDSSPGATASIIPSGSGAGSMASAFVPSNCSLAIQHRTGLSGRWNRGRSFWPELPVGDTSNNLVDADYVSSVLAAFAAVRAALEAGGFHHVVVSRWLDKALRANAVYIAVTSYAVADRVVDSMSRRLPKRGN